jgi:hypothetical protein
MKLRWRCSLQLTEQELWDRSTLGHRKTPHVGEHLYQLPLILPCLASKAASLYRSSSRSTSKAASLCRCCSRSASIACNCAYNI